MTLMRSFTLGAAVCIAVLAPAAALAQASELETMAGELARLRAEVEGLTSELDEIKEEDKRQLRALNTQRTQLEAEIQREELRLKQLRQALEKVKQKVREAGALEAGLKPAVLEAIETVKKPVKAGLPFRVDERIADLDKLKDEVASDTVLPSVAVQRLWSRVEDEMRLGRENGLYRQVIDLDGEEILADVARIGMIMMYFNTPDGRSGAAVKRNGEWTYETYTNPEHLQRLDVLFDNLRRRVRIGFFELPNALPEGAL